MVASCVERRGGRGRENLVNDVVNSALGRWTTLWLHWKRWNLVDSNFDQILKRVSDSETKYAFDGQELNSIRNNLRLE
jgi:hypothetical protein